MVQVIGTRLKHVLHIKESCGVWFNFFFFKTNMVGSTQPDIVRSSTRLRLGCLAAASFDPRPSS